MTGQSAKGMYDTFKRFADETMFASSTILIPMLQNHPMPAERMAALEELVQTPVLGQEGPARAAIPPRHDAGEAVRLHGAADHRAAALSAVRHQPAGPLRPRHCDLPVRRRARRPHPDRRPDRGDAQQPVFLRAQRPGAARRRTRAGGDRAAAPRRRSWRPIPRSSRSCWRRRSSPPTTPRYTDEAIPLLRAALAKEPESGDAYEQLAMAYGRKRRFSRCRSRLGAGRFRARRQQDRPRTRGAGEEAVSGRLARLGQGRRYRRFQPKDKKPALGPVN